MITVLDASLVIAFFDSGDEHHQAATQILTDAGDDDLILSSLTLAEVMVGPARTSQEESLLQALARLEISEEASPQDVAVQLAQLRARTGLKLPDCCVLLAAQTAAASTVATFDCRLAQAARDRGLRTVGAAG